jgi:signal transduction histidine kinase
MSLARKPGVSHRLRTPPADVDLLLQRTRAGQWVVLAAVAFFALADLGIPDDIFGTAYALKAGHAALSLGLLGFLRWAPSPRVTFWAALATVNLAYVFFAVGDVVKGHEATTPLVCLTCSMTAAALLPWGMRAQLATALFTSVGNVMVLRATGTGWGAVIDPAASMAATQAVAVYIAWELERFRQERRRVEHELASRARTEALRAEVRVALSEPVAASERLARCARAIAAELEVPGVALLTFEPRGPLRLRAVAGIGERDSLELLRLGGRPAVTAYLTKLEPRVLAASTAEGVIVDAAWAAALGFGAVAVCALVAGGEVIGLVVLLACGSLADKTIEALRAVADTVAGGIANVRTEEAKARLLSELERANKVKSEFVSTMSHELRTPLNVIMGYADMLGDPQCPDPAFALGRIRQANNELLELIEATLDLNRLESGRDEPSYEPVDLDDLWRELEAEYAPAATRAGLRLSFVGGARLSLRTDRRKLKTIVKNLVGNALKFTARGSVSVRAEQANGQCVLTVEDSGIGIPAESLPHIFEMFRQVDSSDRRSYGGVGLGLHIVQRLCTQLGAEIAVASQVGRGTSFTVRVPLAPPVVCAA